MRFWLSIVFFACACQADEAQLDAIESTLRDDPTRGGKVGYVRGLEVRRRARQLLAHPAPEPECTLADGDRRTVLTFRVFAGSRVASTSVETREWRPSEQSLVVKFEANGAEPTTQVWRLKDGLLFHRDQTSDVWFRRNAQPSDGPWLTEQGTLAAQWLMDLAPGWRRDGDAWVLGTQPLRCEVASSRRAAKERLGARGELVEARVRRFPGGRQTHMAFERRDGARVEVDIDERHVLLPQVVVGTTVEAPRAVSVDARFEAWEKSGLIFRELIEP